MTFSPDSLAAQVSGLPPHCRIVVGYSGGLDSHVLLHALASLRTCPAAAFTLEAVHVHHGISPQADAWVAHCQSVCMALKVPLKVRYVRDTKAAASLENRLREARYAVFSALLGENDCLALAHHADDQAETLLLRLFRGSGLQGMAGMPAQRPLGEGLLIRPLLSFSRAELTDYAQRQKLQWIEDESNQDTGFDRNYMRHCVLPQVAARWPRYRDSLARYAGLNRQAQQDLQFFLERELRPVMAENHNGLPCSWLNRFAAGQRFNLLRAWLALRDLALPDQRQLQRLLSEVVQAREDAEPLLCWPGVEVRRYRGVIYAARPLPEFDAQLVRHWDMAQPLVLPGAGQLAVEPCCGAGLYVPPGATIRVGYRKGGERCQPSGRAHSQTLKKLLQSWQVPPWLRDRVPLIYINDALAAVADLAICAGFEASGQQPGYRLTWQRPD